MDRLCMTLCMTPFVAHTHTISYIYVHIGFG